MCRGIAHSITRAAKVAMKLAQGAIKQERDSISATSSRIWHGTLDGHAWKLLPNGSSTPKSRATVIKTGTIAGTWG